MDILLNNTNDLDVKNGDFVIGDSQYQETNLLLLTSQGEWKSDALTGINLPDLLNSEVNEYTLKLQLKKGLEYDKKKLKTYKNGILTIE